MAPVRSPDRGSVTAETAVTLPALAAVLLASLWSVAAVTAQVRCVDAARVAARALARGEPTAWSVAAARRAAPAGAKVAVSRSAGLVVVEVTATARAPGPWSGAVPGLTLRGRAVAEEEGSFDIGAAAP